MHGAFGRVIVRESEMRYLVRIRIAAVVIVVVVVDGIAGSGCGGDFGDAGAFILHVRVDDTGGVGADGPLQRMRNTQARVLKAGETWNKCEYF